MFKKIELTACEMQSVIHFLNARNIKPADIHHQLCKVYCEHAVSDSMIRRWVRHFNEGRENVRDDLRSGQPSVAHIIANKEKIQTYHFNSQDHVHSVLGQKRRSACGSLASRLNNQWRCLL
jgi:hypothetical protein